MLRAVRLAMAAGRTRLLRLTSLVVLDCAAVVSSSLTVRRGRALPLGPLVCAVVQTVPSLTKIARLVRLKTSGLMKDKGRTSSSRAAVAMMQPTDQETVPNPYDQNHQQ